MRGTLKVFICFLLPILLLAAGAPDPARAQQQEKRIALVVGNGAYAKSPLATTANDAGLIAQTLQAAGFDVVGARDLDGDTLRKSFRDFIQKAQASGPGTVAMIYLAGYGVQLAGENYFIPVDSNITRDTDIPTEGLRISDYLRQLASIPLKANIVVLDAARAQPFIEGGQPIASGLALVEPDPNMLIAFNAAPGTVAPEEPGPYGIYAQSLAEMIRTGGLSLPEVFDRVRLRVNEASKGAQVPWDEQKISAQFSFFERGPDAPPPQAAPDQVAAIRNKPIRDLGVQDAYAAALERDTLPAYEEFLAAYPGDPLSKRVMAIVAARREAITWRRTYRTDTPEAYWSYLRRYPRGPHAGDARRRLAILTAPVEPPPSFAMIDYDVPPPPPDEIVYVDRPVLYFSDPDVRLRAATAAAGLLSAAAAAGFRRAGAAARRRRPVRAAAAGVRADPGVRQAAGLCGAAAEQHHLSKHPQHDGHQHRDQPAAGPPAAGGRAAGHLPRPSPAVPTRRAGRPAGGRAARRPDSAGQGADAAERDDAADGEARSASGDASQCRADRYSTSPLRLPVHPATPPAKLPQANTLPVPGTHGGPPAPPAGAGPLPGGRPGQPTATGRTAADPTGRRRLHPALAGSSRCADGAVPATAPRRQTRPPRPASRRSRRWHRRRPGPGAGPMASPRPRAGWFAAGCRHASWRSWTTGHAAACGRARADQAAASAGRCSRAQAGRPCGPTTAAPGRGAADAAASAAHFGAATGHGWLRLARSPAPRRRQWHDPRRRRRSPGRRHLRRPGWPSRHRRRRARQHRHRVPALRRRRQRSARPTSPDASRVPGRSVIFTEGGLSRAKAAPKGPYFLASGRNRAIQRAISHGSMAHKAVRWQPGRQRSVLLTRFRRNQPEN